MGRGGVTILYSGRGGGGVPYLIMVGVVLYQRIVMKVQIEL